jgi:starch phosphorylase
MEFLMGRSLLNALYNLGVEGQYAEALTELGYKLETLVRRRGEGGVSGCYFFLGMGGILRL